MQFYKNIVVGLKAVFDAWLAENPTIQDKEEMSYGIVASKVTSFAASTADNKDEKKSKSVNNSLLDFVTLVVGLFGTIENPELRRRVFKYLADNGFSDLNVDQGDSQASQKIYLILLKKFLNHPEVSLDDIRQWIANYDKSYGLDVEFAKVLLDQKAHKKPVADVKKCLVEFANQKIISEEQLLSWLSMNDKEGLAVYLVANISNIPLNKLMPLLAIIVTVPAEMQKFLGAKLPDKSKPEVARGLMLLLDEKNLSEEHLLKWLAINDVEKLVGHILNRRSRLPVPQHVAMLNAIAAAEKIDVSMKAKQKILGLMLELRPDDTLMRKEVLVKWIMKNDHEQQLLLVYVKRLPNECKLEPEDNSLVLARWLSSERDGFAEMWSWIQLNNKGDVLFNQIGLYLKTHPQRLNPQQIAEINKARDNNADAKIEIPRNRI